jgi:hypothetical protein
VSFGKDFVIMGGDRVEVSPDGEKVTAYAKDDVEAKAASGVIPVQGGSFSADFNTVVLNGVTIVRAADGHLVISVPGGVVKQGAAPANDGLFVPPVASSDVSRLLRAKATLEIGAVESTGEHKGEIYGGIYPADKNPIWFSAAPKSMDHFNAASWATEQGGALPTRKQGDYLTTLKDKGGAFTFQSWRFVSSRVRLVGGARRRLQGRRLVPEARLRRPGRLPPEPRAAGPQRPEMNHSVI